MHRRKLSMEVALFLLSILSPLLLSVYGIDSLSILEKPYACFEAIYQFGDSIADTGNNVREISDSDCRRPPYGETFFGHPTGRCSNGLLMIDFIAQALDLPFLDPYLNKEGNFRHGVNFAVAGATALSYTTLAAKNISTTVTNSSLSVQLDWFKSHLNTICTSPSECKKKLRKALFLVGEIGGNDFSYAASQGKTLEDIRSMVPEVVQTIMNVVKDLIDLGAKRIIVPGNFPGGCMTIILAGFRTNDSTMYDELNCLRSWNEFAMFYNVQLQTAINDLQKKHHSVAIVYGDYYTPFISILKRAPSLGFDEGTLHKACCGSGDDEYNFDSAKFCGSDGAGVCPDPDKRVVWDGIHLTQHAYKIMANWLLKYIVPKFVQDA